MNKKHIEKSLVILVILLFFSLNIIPSTGRLLDDTTPPEISVTWIIWQWKEYVLVDFLCKVYDNESGVDRVEMYYNDEIFKTEFNPEPEFLFGSILLDEILKTDVFKFVAYNGVGLSAYAILNGTDSKIHQKSQYHNSQHGEPIISNLLEKSTVSYDSNTLYVGGSGPDNYSKIQDAIDNASDGDTVFVYNGTYKENILITKSISVIGHDKNTTIIRDSYSGEKGVLYLKASNISIKGFEITDGQSGFRVGSSIPYDSITISDCNIVNNTRLYGGIWLEGYLSKILIENCYINGNNDLGVRIGKDVDNVRFLDCFFDDDEVIGEGVDHLTFEKCGFDKSEIKLGTIPSNYFYLHNCTFKDNLGFNVYIHDGSNQIIENCTFTNCGISIELLSTNRATIRNCVISNDYIHGDDTQGIVFRGNNLLLENVKINTTYIGLYLSHGGRNIVVRECDFTNNIRAIQHYTGGKFNRFIKNNFINNNYPVYNEGLWVMLNFYFKNYWDNWIGYGPYHVYGLLNWDFFPAKEPYDIGV